MKKLIWIMTTDSGRAAGKFCRRKVCGKFLPRRAHLFHGTRIANKIFVARKFQAPGTVRTTADNAAMNLRMATMQLAGLRIPPRVRTVPPLRRKLSVTAVAEPAQPVIIRHVRQNLGTPVGGPRLVQSLPLEPRAELPAPSPEPVFA
jgi:hypothetical protein